MLSINFNEISIPMIRYGCFSCEFDDNYPFKSNESLTKEEFEKSINEINSSCRLSLKEKVSFVICLFSILIGLPLAVCGGIIEEIRHEKLYFILVAFGVLMMIFGLFFYVLCFVKINSNRWNRIKKQVDCQSSKLIQWEIHEMKDSKEFNLIDYHYEIVLQPSHSKCDPCLSFVDIDLPSYSDLYNESSQ